MTHASLPMYDLPELREAVDSLWHGFARAFRAAGLEDVPDRLERSVEPERQWHDPALFFSQTCGYPLTHDLRGAVRLVATPGYRADGCDGPAYSSALVVRSADSAGALGDLVGRRCAFNARNSQSGFNALRELLAPLARRRAILSEAVETGGHADSIAAVAEGRADFAAVDCVTLALLARYRPAAVASLRVLTFSRRAPGLPFVTHGSASDDKVERLRRGLAAALADPALESVRKTLLLESVVVLSDKAYRVIDEMEQEARALGYPDLA